MQIAVSSAGQKPVYSRHESNRPIDPPADQKAERMQLSSNTGAMVAIYEQHAAALDKYLEALGHIERWRGALFVVHGRLVGMELFDTANTWFPLLPQIVRSYAVEALEEPADQQKRIGSAPGVLLDVVADANTWSFTICGDGFDLRINGSIGDRHGARFRRAHHPLGGVH
jgi:hypothetical protein